MAVSKYNSLDIHEVNKAVRNNGHILFGDSLLNLFVTKKFDQNTLKERRIQLFNFKYLPN